MGDRRAVHFSKHLARVRPEPLPITGLTVDAALDGIGLAYPTGLVLGHAEL